MGTRNLPMWKIENNPFRRRRGGLLPASSTGNRNTPADLRVAPGLAIIPPAGGAPGPGRNCTDQDPAIHWQEGGERVSGF
eukprot:2229122-Rhodomonas_salina.1